MVLLVVAAAAALDLGLGALWVASVVGVAVVRRRRRWVPGAVLAGVVVLGAAGTWLGWFPPPVTASYEVDWVFGGAGRRDDGVAGRADALAPGDLVRAGLRERREQELARPPGAYGQHAAAAVALSRGMAALRAQAPREVAALEAATRRLALTVTSREFQDLERRRARVADYLDALEARLADARDASEIAEVARALDPAVTAWTSLRPLEEDLGRVGEATRALLRALGHQPPTLSASTAARYDEGAGRLRLETRYAVGVEAPLRLARLQVPRPAGAVTVAHGGGAPVAVAAGTWVDLPAATRDVVVGQLREATVTPRPVRSPLRPIAFRRIVVAPEPPLRELAVDVELGPGLDARLLLVPPVPVLVRVAVPPGALHHASRPGTVARDPDEDRWLPAGGEAAGVVLELAPPTGALRTRALVALRPYIYRANPAAILALLGLGALAVCLSGGARRPPS